MILINLLPVEMRQVEKKTSTISIRKIILAIYSLVILGILYHGVVFLMVKSELGKMNTEYAQLKSTSDQASQYAEKLEKDLQPQNKFFNQYVIPSVYISEIMNQLSDLLPDSMWFSQVRIRRDKAVVNFDVEGYTKVTSKQVALAQIQEYVNSIKSKLEEMINRGLDVQKEKAKKIKVVLSTNREQMGSVEVMQFNVSFQTISESGVENGPAASKTKKRK